MKSLENDQAFGDLLFTDISFLDMAQPQTNMRPGAVLSFCGCSLMGSESVVSVPPNQGG